jgi:hypothetical protein
MCWEIWQLICKVKGRYSLGNRDSLSLIFDKLQETFCDPRKCGRGEIQRSVVIFITVMYLSRSFLELASNCVWYNNLVIPAHCRGQHWSLVAVSPWCTRRYRAPWECWCPSHHMKTRTSSSIWRCTCDLRTLRCVAGTTFLSVPTIIQSR